MAELQERLEALERRMERAEAALRERPLAALQLHGVPVLFEDVAVRFSRQEWAILDEGQKEMYRSVMEGNYEMLVSLYSALSKPELLLQLEREELSTPPELETEAAEVSPELAVEPALQNCTSNDAPLETETVERGCREPEESGNVAEKSGNLVEESENLVEESWSLVEISGNLLKEMWDVTEEKRSPAEENRSAAKESGNLVEESRSTAVPENCNTPPVPLEATAVLADLSQPTQSPPCSVSVHCQEAVGQNCSPPAAGDAEAGIPMEVPQEEVAAEKPSMPKTSSKGLEEDKGQEEEAVKDSGNTGQDLVANITEEPGKEVTPDVHKMTEQADPSPGEPEKDSCVGRPVALQRNSSREFYSCPICRKTFLLKINLLIHQRGHNNWVPYVCVHCDRKFMSKKKIRRHLRAWAANGTCQPSELEVCPSQMPFPASHPQTWPANGTYQASKPEECPSRTPCPTSQPQAWAPNGTCQPLDAKACPSQGTLCPTPQPQTWAPNGTCQPLDAEACPTQGTPCPTPQPQTWAANGTCQPLDAEARPNQGTPCPTSQPQAWAPNGPCQPLDAEARPNQGTPCPTSQPQTWAPNGTCQPLDAEARPTQGTPCPTSQPQTWAPSGTCQPLDAEARPTQGTLCPISQPQTWVPNGTCQPLDAKACPTQGTPCPTSQPQTWAANGTCQPLDAEACPSQGTLYPTPQPQTWAPNGTCQPLDAEACPSQGTPCPTSQSQTWAPSGTCQPLDAKACPSQGTPCPTSQPQTWAPNGTCQPLDAKACPSQGTPCPTSQSQTWAPNGTCQPLDAKACPSQGPCPASQCPTSQSQTWAANGTCQASMPEECPSQTLCPSSQPQAPSRDCGTVWQEPGPARCSLPPGKVMYTCTECRETFSNQVFLTVHQRRHSGHHLILCPCCNRSFTWVSDFVRQHWMLMGVRPHQCGICQKTFKRFSHLKAHQRIHRRQERPFTCANPGPIVAAPAAGDGVGSQAVTPQGWGAAVGP
ncbi:mucin-2-like isoform X1 [Haemorhous mexicanus]|uniref:mucin-2-like isoform X1 n=1 Tax=Haemorhous mexicanus TaxID=30427 RepID=UPI0028BE531B|nr:mucin-2-like isoform X1 [Haemorhous mexicanus]